MVGWVAPICEETNMQVLDIRSRWIPLQKGRALRAVVSVEFLFLAVVAGFAQGSWTILVVVFLVLQCSSMAITVRTTFQVVVSIIWAYIGFKIGSWSGSNRAGIIFAAYFGTVAFWLHFLHAKMLAKMAQTEPSGQAEPDSVGETSWKFTSSDLTSIFRGASPIYKSGNIDTLQIFIGASVTMFIIGCMELGKDIAHPDSWAASVAAEFQSLPQSTDRQFVTSPREVVTPQAPIRQGGSLYRATVAEWRLASSSQQQSTAEEWVATAMASGPSGRADPQSLRSMAIEIVPV
jgi:hypothetical protein